MEQAAPITPDLLTIQQWDRYDREQHEVWRELCGRRLPSLRATASRTWLEGFDAIGLDESSIPDLSRLNRSLSARTGWETIAVTGFLPASEFFALLSRRRFPTTVTIRPADRLDYVPEPDIFHDVFGHVPLHANPVFADLLQLLGKIALDAKTPEDQRRVTRFFWFTIEFGLIREEGQPRLYGSGLISSAGDGANALGLKCDRRPFLLDEVLEQEFRIDELQDILYVVESFDQLLEATQALERRIGGES